MKVVALIPAHNEAGSIGQTIEALLKQDRRPDEIVVLADNCSDRTLDIASGYGRHVKAIATKGNQHKKSGALNYGWREYCQDADVVICLDADTILPPNAIGDWEKEMESIPELGGSSSKFTMQDPGILTRLQKAEFSKWTDSSLKRGWTSVLAGTGCAIRNSVLKEIVWEQALALNGKATVTEERLQSIVQENELGPWDYKSQVEDFLLTYLVRKRGFKCHVSPTVRAYTDSMKDLKSLWNQRKKWQVGTIEDLISIGFNKLTMLDWSQQALGLVAALSRILWAIVMLISIIMGVFKLQPLWLIMPFIFVANDLKAANRIPHRDWKDMVMAGLLIPQELFCWMRAAWFVSSWFEVFVSKITGKRKDRWALQYAAEKV
jgi:biofilm PGA synthesis N-glycosyltransferase PgaC